MLQIRKFPGINFEPSTMTPDEAARFIYKIAPNCKVPPDLTSQPITVEDLLFKLKGYLPNPKFQRLMVAYATKYCIDDPTRRAVLRHIIPACKA